MKIILRPHIKLRLKERKIPQSYPKKIISQSESRYYDVLSNHRIAIKEFKYFGKVRPMAAVYDIIADEVQSVTVYAISYQEINNRLKSGRWIKYEGT